MHLQTAILPSVEAFMNPQANLDAVLRRVYPTVRAAMPIVLLGVFATMTGCTAIVAGAAAAAGQRIADRAVDRSMDAVDQAADEQLGPPRRRGATNTSTVRRVESERIAEAPRSSARAPKPAQAETVAPPTENAAADTSAETAAPPMESEASLSAVPDAEQPPIAQPNSADDAATVDAVTAREAKPQTPRRPIATGEETREQQAIPWPR